MAGVASELESESELELELELESEMGGPLTSPLL